MSVIIEKRIDLNQSLKKRREYLVDFIKESRIFLNANKAYSLVDIQESFLIGKQIGRFSDHVGCHAYLEIEALDLDIKGLNDAWQKLIQHHEMLHTIILPGGKQKKLESIPYYAFKVYDLGEDNEEQKAGFVSKLRERMSHKVYLPEQWPLFEIVVVRMSAAAYTIHFSIDEWIADFASIEILMKQWYELYTRPVTRLSPLEFTFEDYVNSVAENRRSERYQRDYEYWINKLKTLSGEPLLPVKNRPVLAKGKSCFSRKRLEYVVEKQIFENLKIITADNKTTLTVLLLALFSEVIGKWNESSQFTTIMTFFNRMPLHEKIDQIVGPFISTNIFMVDNPAGLSFAEKLRVYSSQLWEDLDHLSVSGVKALRELKNRRMVAADLSIPVVFTSMVSSNYDEASGKTWADSISYSITQTPQVLLDHQVFMRKNNLHLSWDVVEEWFEPEVLSSMFDDYCRLIKKAGTAGNAHQISFQSSCVLNENRNECHAEFPLTSQQQAYWFGRLINSKTQPVACQFYQEFDLPAIDIPGFKWAMQRLIKTHAMLRVVILPEGNQIIVEAPGPLNIEINDLRDKAEVEIKAQLEKTEKSMVEHVFPLNAWPMFDVKVTLINETQTRVHFSVDMMMADGKSLELIFNDFFLLYSSGKMSVPAVTYRDYILSMIRLRESIDTGPHVEYWENKFGDLPPAPDLLRAKKNKTAEKRNRVGYHYALKK